MRGGDFYLYPHLNKLTPYKLIPKSTLGVNKLFIDSLKTRFELANKNNIIFSDNIYWDSFFKIFYSYLPELVTIKEITLFNILKHDILTNYKGWRHLKGLPVNGQRTWSNGWNSFRNNVILRNFKTHISKKFYGNISKNEFKLAFWAEQVNRLWYQQWLELWQKAKNQRYRSFIGKSNKSALKLDLKSIAEGEIFLPSKDRELTKKQKNKISKTWMMLGFAFGFTKILLKQEEGTARYLIENKKIIPINVITFPKKVQFKPKIKQDEKSRIKAHKLKKKKKKTAWD